MADHINEAELGRSKKSASPYEHMVHLLKLGWNPSSPLIKKYVREHGLEKRLNDYLQDNKILEG
jgi:hypothetical protein